MQRSVPRTGTIGGVTRSEFLHDGHRLVYDEFGSGPRPVILLPGLLLPRTMHYPLASSLAKRGNRVIVIDLLGHHESDRPGDMAKYAMPLFAEQVIGLMDHLELDEAVVGGTSLGANVTLETLVAAPDRVRGAVIEMPVLDNALLGCALAFTPLLVGLTLGAPVARVLARTARLVPRGPVHLLNVGLDWVAQDPKPSASYLQGLFFGRIAPPRSERRRIQTNSLVLGHPRDPIHPFSDADALVRELPNARMVEAGSVFEMRLRPRRLTDEVARFVEECWRPAAASGPQSAVSGRREKRSARA
jgi:pimeloyl-ACP methyl ester carboxylesterase